MAAAPSTISSSDLSSNSRRKKIWAQLARLDSLLILMAHHLDTKANNIDFAQLSEYIRWLIRCNEIHGNTNIGGLLGGLFHRLWTPAPRLADLAKWMDCSSTSLSHGIRVPVFEGNLAVLSWINKQEKQDLAFAAKEAFQLKSDVSRYYVLASRGPPPVHLPKNWVHYDPVLLSEVVWVPRRHYLVKKIEKKSSKKKPVDELSPLLLDMAINEDD